MSAVKIWAKIKNSQQWENPNVRYRTILRVHSVIVLFSFTYDTHVIEFKNMFSYI